MMEEKNKQNTSSQQGSNSEPKRIPRNRRRKKGGCGCGKKKK